MRATLSVPGETIASFCRQNGIRRLAVFGSALREHFGRDSDIDLIVEFEKDRIPSLFGMARLERELSGIFGRKVDLRTPEDLSPYFRHRVLAEAEVQYAAG